MKVIKVPAKKPSWEPCAVVLETREEAVKLRSICNRVNLESSLPSTKNFSEQLQTQLTEELKAQPL